MKLFRKSNKQPQNAAPQPRGDAASLDFTYLAPATPAAPPRPPRVKRKPQPVVSVEQAPQRRSIVVPALAVGAAALAVALVASEPATEATAPRSNASPAVVQTPPPIKPVQPRAALPQPAAVPPHPAAIQHAKTLAVPVDFLQPYHAYATLPGNKAIALALDRNGRWAHGKVAGFSVQPEASEEALVECAKFRAQAGIQENCRLFAVGDKVVW